MFENNDVICALSTSPGVGGIAVIRVSGKKTFEIVERIFSKPLQDCISHTVHFGKIKRSDNSILDEVLVTILHEGKSFTGENTVEIACHGSLFIQKEIIKVLLSNGCRLANPGEFTMRAFLNGNMDLSQAEAVADLIASESSKSHEIAMKQMRGKFSNELKDLREKLINFASLVELELDFSEEDVEFADRTQLNNLLVEVLTYIRNLISSFELGNAIKNGVPVAIVGAPNTGKSTLLNQLLGEERAIVSDIAGTTRDSIEETVNIEGILFRLIDTAGIREGLKDSDSDKIEAIGIERSFEKIQQAKLVLVLTDVNDYLNESGIFTSWVQKIKLDNPEKRVVVLFNKIDTITQKEIKFPLENIDSISISAKNDFGISELKKWMSEQILTNDFEHSTIITSARHLEALESALAALNQAKNGLESNVTGDFIAMDIRQSLYHIGSITGDISTDDLLGNIFSKFCIGK